MVSSAPAVPVVIAPVGSVIHLIGHPGTGKRTVAVALDRHARALDPPWRTVVLDNHLTSHAVLTALDKQPHDHVGDEVWSLVAEVRTTVDRAIRDHAPPEIVFIATNVVQVGRADTVSKMRALAEHRDGAYVPVLLDCSAEERRRRVVAPDRAERRKWMDPDAVEESVATHPLVVPTDPQLLRLDVTHLPPDDAARRIISHVNGLATG